MFISPYYPYFTLLSPRFGVILFYQGTKILEKAEGLHGFMNWKRALLTVRAANVFQ